MTQTASRKVLIPGPEHPIAIEPTPGRVVVRLGRQIVADTRHALTLREASYPAVQYIPAGDVDHTLLTPSDRQTYCPYKGDCSYHGIRNGDEIVADAVWTYEAPFDAVAQIAGHHAFYPDRVDVAQED